MVIVNCSLESPQCSRTSTSNTNSPTPSEPPPPTHTQIHKHAVPVRSQSCLSSCRTFEQPLRNTHAEGRGQVVFREGKTSMPEIIREGARVCDNVSDKNVGVNLD